MNRAAFDDLLSACRQILAAEDRPSQLRADHLAAIAAVRAAVDKAKGEPVRGLVRIIPPEAGPRCTKVQGTRVQLPSGEAVPGVRKIVLVADVGDIWRASIELICHPPTEILAFAEITDFSDEAKCLA